MIFNLSKWHKLKAVKATTLRITFLQSTLFWSKNGYLFLRCWHSISSNWQRATLYPRGLIRKEMHEISWNEGTSDLWDEFMVVLKWIESLWLPREKRIRRKMFLNVLLQALLYMIDCALFFPDIWWRIIWSREAFTSNKADAYQHEDRISHRNSKPEV